jgi:hypothetical protein
MFREYTEEEVLLDTLREKCYNDDSYFKIIASNMFILMGNVIGDDILKTVHEITPMTYYGITYTHLYEFAPNPYPDALMIILADPVFSEKSILENRKEAEDIKNIYLDLIQMNIEN